jgi:uncharacterized membrane protein YjgN (DUF898 family)
MSAPIARSTSERTAVLDLPRSGIRGYLAMTQNSGRIAFDGDVTGYLATRLAAWLVTLLTLGFGFPYGLVLVQRWNARHLVLGGSRVVFTGRARDLLREWVVWWPCVVLTLGFYAFAVLPRVIRWVWDNTDYRGLWQTAPDAGSTSIRPLVAPVPVHLSFFTEPGLHRVQS